MQKLTSVNSNNQTCKILSIAYCASQQPDKSKRKKQNEKLENKIKE